jgi:hypothetical protein
MMRLPRSKRFDVWIWAGLTLLMMCPVVARADSGPDNPNEQRWGLLCLIVPEPYPCPKLRLEWINGLIMAERDTAAATGIRGALVFGTERVQAGYSLIAMSRLPFDSEASFGLGEALLRVAVDDGRYHRIFANISVGGAISDEPDGNKRLKWSVGTSFSIEARSLIGGLYLDVGFIGGHSHRWLVVPHAGVGLIL